MPARDGRDGGGWKPAERTAFNLDRGAMAVPSPPAVAPSAPSTAKDDPAPGEDAGRPVRERRDWAYLGLVAFTLVLFLRPQDLLPPLEVLHLAEIFAIVGIAALINGRLARHEAVLPMTPEVRGVIVFTLILLALVPFSIWPGGSYAMLTGLFLKVVLIFMLVAATVTSAERLERLVWMILLASGYIALRGVLDYARGNSLVENGRLSGAVGGGFSNPNDLAMNMVAFLPPAILLAARRDNRTLRRITAAVVVLLMLVTIVFTKSRGGFLGLGAMLITMMVQGGKVRRGLGGAVIVIIVASLPFLPGSFWDRMASITDASKDETGSRESRQTDMREAWHAFLDRPITGVGPGQFTAYNPSWRQERWREAHNVFLQVAADDGFFGVLAFGYLVVRAFHIAFAGTRLRRLRGPAPGARDADAEGARLFSVAMSASLVGWLVCAMFASIAYTWTFYYVFGIAMAARLIGERRFAVSTPRPSRSSRQTAAA